MCIMVIMILILTLWKISRIFSKTIMMLICLKSPINNKKGVMTKAKPLITIALFSLLMTMTIQCPCPPLHQSVVITTVLPINLVLDSSVVPAHHKCAINAVSAKTPAQSNGLIAKWPLVPRQTKILTSYENLQKLQNLVHLPHCPVIFWTCCHTAAVPLNPTITLTTITAPQNSAAHPAALAVVCTVVTVMVMISAAINHLVLALIAFMLSTRTSALLENSIWT